MTKTLLIILTIVSLALSFFMWNSGQSKNEQIEMLNERIESQKDSLDILNERTHYWHFDRLQAIAIPHDDVININDTIRADIALTAAQSDSYEYKAGDTKVKIGGVFDTIQQTISGDYIELKGNDGRFVYSKKEVKRGKFRTEGVIELPESSKHSIKLPFYFEYEVK